MPARTIWCLEGWSGPREEPWRVPIDRFPFRVGRSSDLELKLGGSLVSKVHAEFFEEDGCLFVRDLDSRNGTLVNFEPVKGARELREWDLVWFANQECRLVPWSAVPSAADADDEDELAGPFRAMLAASAVRSLFQPVLRRTRDIVGYELLSRGAVPSLPTAPAELFDIAERLDLVEELSDTLRDHGLVEARRLPGKPIVFLNTHPQEVRRDGPLLDSLRRFRRQYLELPLVLEIHERAVADIDRFQPFRSEIRDLDIDLAFDDFGAGPSRLRELAELEPRYVKFDRRLVARLHQASTRRKETLGALILIVNELGIATVAEGIECEEDAEACWTAGFDLAQGFWFGEPRLAAEIAAAGD